MTDLYDGHQDHHRHLTRRVEEVERANVDLRAALTKINEIRNSIIGLQSINWSEHIYPLVAALNKAGFEGLGYPEARERFGTMIELLQEAAEHLSDQPDPADGGSSDIADLIERIRGLVGTKSEVAE